MLRLKLLKRVIDELTRMGAEDRRLLYTVPVHVDTVSSGDVGVEAIIRSGVRGAPDVGALASLDVARRQAEIAVAEQEAARDAETALPDLHPVARSLPRVRRIGEHVIDAGTDDAADDPPHRDRAHLLARPLPRCLEAATRQPDRGDHAERRDEHRHDDDEQYGAENGRKHAAFSREDLRELEYASLLHDFGKIGVREKVLVKAKKLYDEQLQIVRLRFENAKLQQRVEMLEAAQIDPAARAQHLELPDWRRLFEVIEAKHPKLLDA